MSTVLVMTALFLGAAWRRWWGSALPKWWPWHKANGETVGLRATQFAAGFVVLALMQVVAGDPLWRCALDSALAIGFMTLPTNISKQPFEFVLKPLHENYSELAEYLQGACLWLLAVLVT